MAMRSLPVAFSFLAAAVCLSQCKEPSPPSTDERSSDAPSLTHGKDPDPPASASPASVPAPTHFFIAIVDSGIDITHPWFGHSFASLEKIRPVIPSGLLPISGDRLIGWDIAKSTASPTDQMGHGTHVAGILAKELGMINTDTPFRLLVFRTGNRNHDLPHVATALRHISALKKAGLDIPVVLLPIEYYPVLGDKTKLAQLEDALASLQDNRTLVITAAGNRSRDNDRADGKFRCYPSSFSFPHLLSAACCNESGHLHPLSNTGALSVDFAAPGFGIESAWLDGETRTNTGSSQSSAFVAAHAAKLWLTNRSQSAADLRKALLKRCRLHPSLVGRVVSHRYLPRAAATK